MPTETSKPQKQREKDWEKKNGTNYLGSVGQLQKVSHVMGMPEEKH